MRLPKWGVRIANMVTNFALITGIPRPPYTRRNALVVETVGRRSGERRRLPVGYLDDGGRIIVVVEDGPRAHWVRNALANDGRLRIHFRGRWHSAHLRILDADPETYLRRMNRVHAGFVHLESTTPGVVEILPEWDINRVVRSPTKRLELPVHVARLGTWWLPLPTVTQRHTVYPELELIT